MFGRIGTGFAGTGFFLASFLTFGVAIYMFPKIFDTLNYTTMFRQNFNQPIVSRLESVCTSYGTVHPKSLAKLENMGARIVSDAMAESEHLRQKSPGAALAVRADNMDDFWYFKRVLYEFKGVWHARAVDFLVKKGFVF